MNLKDFLAMSDGDYRRQMRIYIERNKDYASEEDCLQNDEVMAELCKLLRIDTTTPVGVNWFRFLDKIVRDRNKPKQDNLDDAMNYMRRIMAWRI